ncbi:MAG: formylglycine-generating enzyme family protein [marine benthic group bacterium]|nr:formylglycine-generating enzyme family protein [Gemmatimonadota bacterium]
MRESRRTFVSVLGLYAAGSWLVLQVVDVLNQNLGLPPWAFSLALTLLLVGLPIVAITAWLQTRRELGPSTDQPEGSGASRGARRLFTWRNAALGGLAALALWGVVSTTWLLQARSDDETGAGETTSSLDLSGPTGFLMLETRPSGADVEIRAIEIGEELSYGVPVLVGPSTTAATELPAGEYLLVLTQAESMPLTLLAEITPGDTVSVGASLLPDSPVSSRMVLVPDGPAPAGVGGLPTEAFLIDRHEVTNREYASFMADDGYRTANLWPDSMTIEGVRLARAEAISRLTDSTGALGPRTWSGSVYPSGSADHPATGVSWYEANAYCSWKGKRLPTKAQWWRAALGDGDDPYPWGTDSQTLRMRANFEATGTREVEYSPAGVSEFGVFEMAGNAREWLRPEQEETMQAPSVGGSWQDPEYTFSTEWREALPLGFANETTGFRCIRHVEP